MTDQNNIHPDIVKSLNHDYNIFEVFFKKFVQDLQERLNGALSQVNDKAQFYRFFTAKIFLELVLNDYRQMIDSDVKNTPSFDMFLAEVFNSINQIKDSIISVEGKEKTSSSMH